MITQNENRGSAKGRGNRAFNDYFDYYFEQLERSKYMNRFKDLTPFTNSAFGP